MSIVNSLRKVTVRLSLLATFALTGCGAMGSSAESASPATAVSPTSQLTITLPSPTATPTAGSTQTPTWAEASSVSTNTPAPTPTATLLPLPTVTTDPEPPPSAPSTTTPKDTPVPIEGLGSLPECLSAEEGISPCKIKHVVIISIDGLRPDALAQADTPIMDALQAAGAYSPAAQAVLPSVTLVNHASMLGGMSPEKHGIDWNEQIPSLGKVKGPTLFSAAHEAGLSTGMVVGKPKFDHLVLSRSVDTYIYAGFLDSQVVDRALAVIQTDLPNLFFIHLPDVDTAGHTTSWMSQAQLLVVSRTDSLIGELIAALEAGHYLETTLLLVVSDHGGRETWHGGDSPEETTVPWLAVGPGVPAGIILESEIMMYDTAATALLALNVPIPDRWDGRPVLEIFGQERALE